MKEQAKSDEGYDELYKSNTAFVLNALRSNALGSELRYIERDTNRWVASTVSDYFDDAFSINELANEAARQRLLHALSPERALEESTLAMMVLDQATTEQVAVTVDHFAA